MSASLISFPLFATGVVDTGGKFTAGVIDTGGDNTSYTDGKICRQFRFFEFFVEFSEKFEMTLSYSIFRDLGVDDSWKNLKQKSRDTVPFSVECHLQISVCSVSSD